MLIIRLDSIIILFVHTYVLEVTAFVITALQCSEITDGCCKSVFIVIHDRFSIVFFVKNVDHFFVGSTIKIAKDQRNTS